MIGLRHQPSRRCQPPPPTRRKPLRASLTLSPTLPSPMRKFCKTPITARCASPCRQTSWVLWNCTPAFPAMRLAQPLPSRNATPMRLLLWSFLRSSRPYLTSSFALTKLPCSTVHCIPQRAMEAGNRKPIKAIPEPTVRKWRSPFFATAAAPSSLFRQLLKIGAYSTHRED